MGLNLILIALALSAASGAPGLFMGRASARGQRTAAAFMCVSALAGLSGACTGLVGGAGALVAFPWPAAGGAIVGTDSLSSFFLMPVFLLGALGSIYGLGYWPQARHPDSARKLQLFWGLLVAGMGLLVIARHAMAFLLGWEIMALSAFFLVAAEDRKSESRRAGFIYLIAAHIGTLTLFAMFALWRRVTGSWALDPLAAGAAGTGATTALFLLALIGFGLKAGMMPLHFWLPGAHANAPSHVSAMLSGVVLKMGIYGLLRFLFLLPDPPRYWGALILVCGMASGLLGVVFAIGQHDLKRLLAYHSIENIGIILMGLGLAMLGRASGRADLLVLGLAGCLLHVWNHSLFKSLLFLSAGSAIRGAGTRLIDRMGALARSMPWTAAMFLVGALAICGLPPLNGFVSEFLVYLGLFATAGGQGEAVSAAVAAIPVLAMIGSLALACFVKVYGVAFLGEPRHPESGRARESEASMVAPMLVLALACALIGMMPALLGPVLDAAIASTAAIGADTAGLSLPALASISPLGSIGTISAIAFAAAAAAGGGALLVRRRRSAPKGAPRSRVGITWDCGYAAPGPRMQYTASSFARTIESMFAWALRPRERAPRIDGPFPGKTVLESHVDDAVLDRLLVPAARWTERLFQWFHRFQQGLTQHYILYILITLVLLLSTLIPFGDLIARFQAR